ncbi:hypothetical protein GCM10011450_17880 [Advenella faeciporci]|uniref:Uncharacterized protein n=1 Tax=Advenella faeciporci TaxID=797535 RepID=A0A918JLP7_9BURK|nr:hypothetical protein [Advenella faeciporci]GGW88325.1 hypothetical protein GCM10011450_17880 [Advenella faeciporci]
MDFGVKYLQVFEESTCQGGLGFAIVTFFRSNSARVYPKTPGGEKRNEVQVLTIWFNLGNVKKVVWQIGFNDSPGGLKRTVLKIL